MLYPVEIESPCANQYGNKSRFRLPQEIEIIKSVVLTIMDVGTYDTKLAALPTIIKFDLFKISMLLNNGNDEVIADAPFQETFFQIRQVGFSPPALGQKTMYNNKKVILNKKIIKNSVHFVVSKITADLINYVVAYPAAQPFLDYLRSDAFKLTLYVETA